LIASTIIFFTVVRARRITGRGSHAMIAGFFVRGVLLTLIVILHRPIPVILTLLIQILVIV
jgi:hypothetical protein